MYVVKLRHSGAIVTMVIPYSSQLYCQNSHRYAVTTSLYMFLVKSEPLHAHLL